MVERPGVAHSVVRGDADLALGAKDPPLNGWDLGLFASVSRLRVETEVWATVELIGEDSAGREDGVEVDLVWDVVGSCSINHLSSERVVDGHCRVVVDEQRLVLFDLSQHCVVRYVSLVDSM